MRWPGRNTAQPMTHHHNAQKMAAHPYCDKNADSASKHQNQRHCKRQQTRSCQTHYTNTTHDVQIQFVTECTMAQNKSKATKKWRKFFKIVFVIHGSATVTKRIETTQNHLSCAHLRSNQRNANDNAFKKKQFLGIRFQPKQY